MHQEKNVFFFRVIFFSRKSHKPCSQFLHYFWGFFWWNTKGWSKGVDLSVQAILIWVNQGERRYWVVQLSVHHNWTNTKLRLFEFVALKLDAHWQQVPCCSVCSSLWWVEKENIGKICCRKQDQTLFNSPLHVHLLTI